MEFLRDTGSDVCERVDDQLAQGFHVCDPVRLEVLAGARDDTHLRNLRALVAAGSDLSVTSEHFELAASLYRECRRRGRTVRKLCDCLIAAVAISADVPLLHSDTDFDALVECTALRSA